MLERNRAVWIGVVLMSAFFLLGQGWEATEVPAGGILMWSGSIESIPEGWALCDGTEGTPDLTDRFIVGAGVTYSPGDIGGEAEHVLTVDEMPSHSHSITYEDNSGGQVSPPFFMHSNGQPHQAYTNETGEDLAHENRPPYYALAFIMKL